MEELSQNYTQRDIYYYYIKSRASYNNRGFRMPNKKPFDEWIKTKPVRHQESLKKITERFNTLWCHVVPLLYFECGFKLFGAGFSYHRFFEPTIMIKYVRERKFKEHSDQTIKNKTKSSIKHIVSFIRSNTSDINSVEEYFKKKTGHMPVFIQHFLREQINDMVLAYVWTKHRLWIQYVDPDIMETYLGTFKRRVYKHINYLVEHEDLYQLIERSFAKI